MNLNDYSLADKDLLEFCREKAARGDFAEKGEVHRLAYIPNHSIVVLGAGNETIKSVKVSACEADGIGVIKRPSGGEAVLVSPQTVCFTCCLLTLTLPRSADFFDRNLDFISGILMELGVLGIERRGISDLCIRDYKFLGSAIYRRPCLILFQAVINLSEPGETIARYLLQPSRMPDYRANRPHEIFVRSLAEQGYTLDAELLKALLENAPFVIPSPKQG